MIDFVLSIFSTVLQLDMRDHHSIPFALPLAVAIVLGGALGLTILKFIGNEQNDTHDPRTHTKE